MNFVVQAVATAVNCIADRLRGSGKEKRRDVQKWVFSALNGVGYSAVLAPSIWLLDSTMALWEQAAFVLGCAVANVVGTQMGGWGNVLGPIFTARRPVATSVKDGVVKDEREKVFKTTWQRGIFLKSAFAAAVFRGALWGACFVPLFFFVPGAAWMLPVMTVAFAAAPYIARRALGGPINLVPSTDPTHAAESKRADDMWARNEQIRAVMASSLIAVVMAL